MLGLGIPELAILLIFGLVSLPWILYLLTLRKSLRLTQKYHDISPGLVWLLLIPIFNLGWQFYILKNITKGIKGKFNEMGKACGDGGWSIGLAFSILAFMYVCVLEFIPDIRILFSIGTFFTWLIYWNKIVKFNRLILPTQAPESTSQDEADKAALMNAASPPALQAGGYVCSDCGANVSVTDTRCPQCGGDLPGIEHLGITQKPQISHDVIKTHLADQNVTTEETQSIESLSSPQISPAVTSTKSKTNITLFIVVFILLIVCGVGYYFYDRTPARIYQKNKNAVVLIAKYDIFDKLDGYGSGFIIDGRGVIATNYHVIKGAFDIKVKTADDRLLVFDSIQYADKENDVALIRVKTPQDAKLSKINIGDSMAVKVGETVYVIGNPKGLENTFSEGIVSGIRENNIIQITAPISPGSSGGPVLDRDGNAIGISTSQVQGGQNLNFAVPINFIKDAVLSINSNVSSIKPIETIKEKPQYRLVITQKEIDLAEGYVAVKDWNGLEQYARGLTQVYSSDATSWFYLGYALYEKRNYESAIQSFDEAIVLNPNESQFFNLRGHAYFALEKQDDAYGNYCEAISRNPNEAVYYYNRASVYPYDSYHRERNESTFADYQASCSKGYSDACNKIREIEANLVTEKETASQNESMQLVADAADLVDAGQYQMALDKLNKAIMKDHNNYRALFYHGLVFYRTQRYYDAIADFTKAIGITDAFPDYFYYRGLSYEKLRQYRSAVDDFNKVITMNPQDINPRDHRAYVYKITGHLDWARADFESSCRLGSKYSCNQLKALSAQNR